MVHCLGTIFDVKMACFKVVLLGDGEVGKTSFLFRYIDGLFHSEYVSTIKMNFNIKEVQVEGQLVKLQIWDTVGQERKDRTALAKSYIRGAHGCVLLFDVTNRATFEVIGKWVEIYKDYTGLQAANIVLAGNKTDLEANRQVSREEAESRARELSASYFETSAKTGAEVDSAFMTLAREMLMARLAEPQHRSSVSLSRQHSKTRHCCRS
jgi:small GTP-binding protein